MPDFDMYGKPVVLEGPTGIGGWLVLPLVGLVGTLLLTGANLIIGFRDVTPDVLRAIMAAETPPMETIRTALICSLLAGFAILGTASHSLYLFLRKRRALPNAITAHYMTVVAALGADLYAAHLLESVMPGEGGVRESVQWLIRGVIGGALWIAYFRVSVRVKNTFVH